MGLLKANRKVEAEQARKRSAKVNSAKRAKFRREMPKPTPPHDEKIARPAENFGAQFDTLKGTKMQRTRALLVRNFAQRKGKKALITLAEVMENTDLDPRTRMMAAIALLDRGFGKPAQEVQHTGKDGEPFRAVIELPSNMRSPQPIALLENRPVEGLRAHPDTIDATVIPDEDDLRAFDDDEEFDAEEYG